MYKRQRLGIAPSPEVDDVTFIRRVTIDDSLMGDDKEVLEDLIAAAVNDAVRRVEKTSQEKMGGLASGLNIPGLNLTG